ncbi:MAG: PAS domain-containing sensor histidine kinase [Chthoniobacterales bacterium]
MPVAPRSHQPYPISLDDLAQALDHSDEGFALTDPEGNYVYINDAHLRIYGYEHPQELLGRSWRTLYIPVWVRHFEEAVLPILPRDKVWRGQAVGCRRDGSPFLAGITLTMLPDGKITCNCRDESREPDSFESTKSSSRPALRALGEKLIAGLPARLRRPLDMLSGYSSFLLGELEAGREVPPDCLREGLAEIDAAGRRLAEQMRRLDLVAELTAEDDMAASPTADEADEHWPARLMAACRNRAEAVGRGEDLTVSIKPGKPAISYRALECVVLELLANALQSSRPGDSITIIGQPEGSQYVFRLCDQGVGLPAAEWPSSNSRPLGQDAPAGFGLAVVHYILRRVGGCLTLEQPDHCSTCLKVSLPRRN